MPELISRMTSSNASFRNRRNTSFREKFPIDEQLFSLLFTNDGCLDDSGVPRLIQQYRLSKGLLSKIPNANANEEGGDILHSLRSLPPPPRSLTRRISSSAHAKHLQTAKLIVQHSLKTKIGRYINALDEVLNLIAQGADDDLLADAYHSIAYLLDNGWILPRIGHDMVYALSDHLRESNFIQTFVQVFCDEDIAMPIRLAAGSALEFSMVNTNRDYALQMQFTEQLHDTTDQLRTSFGLVECFFKHGVTATQLLIEKGVLEFILKTCKKTQGTDLITLRSAANALANAVLFGDTKTQYMMVNKQIPEWLFLLLNNIDSCTAYYAGFAICGLACNQKLKTATSFDALQLVEPLLKANRYDDLMKADHKLAKGRSVMFLRQLLPMLSASVSEARSIAAYHFCIEAKIKHRQDRLDVFRELSVVPILHEVASSPAECAAKFASQALEIIGETAPRRLSQKVPLWTVDDVQDWVNKIGFADHSAKFTEQKVDGDLLLRMSEEELAQDIGITSRIMRKRFMRELESLKLAADYGTCDPTKLDRLLVSIFPQLSIYAYRMLELGIDRNLMPNLTDDMLENECGMTNPVHRMRLMEALKAGTTKDEIELNVLRRQIDIFISYRRSNGNQLASLLRVLLQLRGYKVFIDVDRLSAGQFDTSLYKHIRAAPHFVLVLTENALDRVIGDNDCEDWIHKEILCALEHGRNVIPIFDANFVWPEETSLPIDIRRLTQFNGIRWVHEYQEACVFKLERFLSGEGNAEASITPKVQRSGSCSLAPMPPGTMSRLRSNTFESKMSQLARGSSPTPPPLTPTIPPHEV